MEDSDAPSPKRARCLQDQVKIVQPADGPERRVQVFLRQVDIEGFKTFRARECIDICPGWKPLHAIENSLLRKGNEFTAPSPLTIILGGNGAGKSAVFDAVLFVLGQSSRSIRSRGSVIGLVNDETVRHKGNEAAATVNITFQRPCRGSGTRTDTHVADTLEVYAAGDQMEGYQNLSVGRSVKHGTGTSTYSVQGKACSRVEMMESLSAFVGTDMSDVDRYVLKQGSTMVCRREGKYLLSFIERLAGTSKLKIAADEAQDALDDLREKVQRVEVQMFESLHERKQLQPQVDTLLALQKDADELNQERIGVWQRKLASLRVKEDDMRSAGDAIKREAQELKDAITSSKAREAQTLRELAQATRDTEDAQRKERSTRSELQKAKAAQAEEETLKRKAIESARSKGKVLARALSQLKESEAEAVKLSRLASNLQALAESMNIRIKYQEEMLQVTTQDAGVTDEQQALAQELRSLENGPIAELEKAITTRKKLEAQARETLERLMLDLDVARIELEGRETAAKSSREDVEEIMRKVAKVAAESGDVNQSAQMQQGLVDNLERQHAGYLAPGCPPNESGSSRRRGAVTERNNHASSAHSRGEGRIGSLRSFLSKLRDKGVHVHGMLADLVILRRRKDERAVIAVLGSALRSTIVVQTRADGARCVAGIKDAGIRGQIRCDVLDEMEVTSTKASGGRGYRQNRESEAGGLTPLSDCVTTSDPGHLPAVKKHLRGWLLSENRQAAWGAKSGVLNSNNLNIVTSSGELFYASGEVAVKPLRTHGLSQTPRLREIEGEVPRGESELLRKCGSSQEDGRGGGGGGNAEDIERRLNETKKSLLASQTRSAELEREEAQAKFDLEDAQLRHSTAQKQLVESRQGLTRLELKVSAQHHLLLRSTSGSNHMAIMDDEAELSKLQERRAALVIQLHEGGEGLCGRLSKVISEWTAATRMLDDLKAEADKTKIERDEVDSKLKLLGKREKTRRARVEALSTEREKLETAEKSSKGKHSRKGDIEVNALASKLEVEIADCRKKRETERKTGKVAVEKKRELGVLRDHRAELSKKHGSLKENLRKVLAEFMEIKKSLSTAVRVIFDSQVADQGSDNEGTNDKDAARLSRQLEEFVRVQPHQPSLALAGSHGDKREQGRICYNMKTSKGEGGDDGALPMPGKQCRNEDPKATDRAICPEEDEIKVAEFMINLTTEGEDDIFRKETRILEASVRLKEATYWERRETVDTAAVSQAVRLDSELSNLRQMLRGTRESMVALMDTKEAIDANRHSTLIACLEDLNGALGGIYRRLTCTEEDTNQNLIDRDQNSNKYDIRGAPRGDCFLRFSRERTLLLDEGITVQAKPEPGSPWRGPGSLSGGQMALVGLALHLASQDVRPAPLYLMDEIDSALDTHKVVRVAAMLADRASTGNEQCVIISHRPEMQKRGSHLLGVYHCQGTAKIAGLQLLRQLVPLPSPKGADRLDRDAANAGSG